MSIMPKTLAFNYITKSAVEKNCLARQIIFDFDLALLYIMSMHVFITNLSIVVPKRDGILKKKCRKKPSAVDRTDVSDVDRTDRLHRQSTFYLTHCAAGDAAPGEAQPGCTLFTHWATWCVVLSTGHGCFVALRGLGICSH